MSVAPSAEADVADTSKSTTIGALQKLLNTRAQLQKALQLPQAAALGQLDQAEATVVSAHLNTDLAKVENKIQTTIHLIREAHALGTVSRDLYFTIS